MDTVQILCRLRDVRSFLDVFPSDFPPQSITRTSTVIVYADPQTEGASHWLAVLLRPKSSSAYYFDSYGIVALVPSFQTFIKRNCMTWDYKRRQLQGLTTDVCGKFIRPLRGSGIHTATIHFPLRFLQTCRPACGRLCTVEFWDQMSRGDWGQCCRNCL